LSGKLGQEAIAQKTAAGGELHGPGAEAWRPFNDKFFINHVAQNASKIKPSAPAATETPSFRGAVTRAKKKQGNISLPDDEVPF
jgi:hypothetical protein